MSDKIVPKTNQNCVAWLVGLMGITIIIVIHELGHFLAAHLFNIPTPTFSIGFGPALVKIPIGTTTFQLSLLPIGGYVEINQEILAQQSYIHKMIVILAGIVFNIIFSFIIVAYYRLRSITQSSPLPSCLEYIKTKSVKSHGIVGPIGLIQIIGQSFLINKQLFWMMLSIISLNIAFFNILPLPFFDGGQAFLFTLQAILGKEFSSNIISIVSFLLFFLFILLLSIISMRDIKNLKNK